MTKILLGISALSMVFGGNTLIAQSGYGNSNPNEMNKNEMHKTMTPMMETMAEAFNQKLGKELQLRAVDLYLFAEGLKAQKNPNSQEQGDRLLAIAQDMFALGERMVGQQVSHQDVKDFVSTWGGQSKMR